MDDKDLEEAVEKIQEDVEKIIIECHVDTILLMIVIVSIIIVCNL